MVSDADASFKDALVILVVAMAGLAVFALAVKSQQTQTDGWLGMTRPEDGHGGRRNTNKVV